MKKNKEQPKEVEKEQSKQIEQPKQEESKQEELINALKRVQADFINYKNRIEKEKEQLKLHTKAELVLKLITIKEDFERAIKNTEDNGIKMIHNQLKKVLEEEGVREIDAVGKDLDYDLHEVVKTVKSGDNKIVEEIQKGYLIKDKVLKPSKVVLGSTEIENIEVKENE